MSSNQTSNRRTGRVPAMLSGLALALALSTGTASAMSASGEVSLSLKAGAESSLLRQTVKATYSAKTGKTGTTKRVATAKRGKSGGATKLALPIVDVEMLGAATVRAGGAVELTSEDAKARLSDLTLQIAGRKTAISAKLGKRRLIFFRAEGKPAIDASSLELSKAPLSLTEKGAQALRDRLGLDGITAGRLGSVDVDARFSAPAAAKAAEQGQPEQPKSQEIIDPFAQQCALKVKSETAGAAAGPAAAPTFASPAALTGGKIEWGLSAGLRYYVVEISGGSLVPIAPAEILNPPLPAPQIGSFRFPAKSGEYEINAPENDGDDQAIVNGEGTVVLCNLPHGFRVALSNPTVTIDGANSRLTVDVDTNMSGFWTPTQRVDLATLDLDGADPFYNENAKTVTWSSLPATLTEAGEEALQLCNPQAPGPCDYEEGDPVDPVTVTAGTATEEAWPFASACTVASPATASTWPAAPAASAALPALTAPEQISTASISWGLRNSLRSTVNDNGVFNLSGGTTRSDAVSMKGAGKFFTWPGTSAEYEPGTPGRLIVRGSGSVALCNTGHGFGTVLSNPTLVIDGANSRLVMDISSRIGVSWTSGRVDVASLAVSGVTVATTAGPGAGEETITWTFPDPGVDSILGGAGSADDDTDSVNSTVKLTKAGGSALALLGLANAGTSLNKVAVSIVHPTD